MLVRIVDCCAAAFGDAVLPPGVLPAAFVAMLSYASALSVYGASRNSETIASAAVKVPCHSHSFRCTTKNNAEGTVQFWPKHRMENVTVAYPSAMTLICLQLATNYIHTAVDCIPLSHYWPLNAMTTYFGVVQWILLTSQVQHLCDHR